MKIEEYGPKAREAFGKTLIDISLSIYKGVILLFTVLPLASIAKSVFVDGDVQGISIVELINSLAVSTKVSVFLLVSVAFVVAHYFRKEGLRHIHESEISQQNIK